MSLCLRSQKSVIVTNSLPVPEAWGAGAARAAAAKREEMARNCMIMVWFGLVWCGVCGW